MICSGGSDYPRFDVGIMQHVHVHGKDARTSSRASGEKDLL